jgi:hypothetical protein
MRQLVKLLMGMLCLSVPYFAFAQAAPSRVVELVSYDNADIHFNAATDSVVDYSLDSISVTLLVILPNGQAPDSIHTLLGSSIGTGNLSDKTFKYDGAATLQDGTTYRRDGQNLYLGLGHYTGVANVYGKVQLVYTGGNRSSYTSASN